MKYDIGELYTELSSHFNFHLNQTIFMTTLHETYMCFCAYFESNLLNIFQSKEYFKHMLEIKIKHNFMFNTLFRKSYGFWDNWTNQLLCVNFQMPIFSNHYGLPVTPKTWIISVFQLFMHIPPFVRRDNQGYIALFFKV